MWYARGSDFSGNNSSRGIPEKRERKISMKVLVVIDMQNDFLTVCEI